MEIFFGGSGWKLFYLIGVSKFLQQHFSLQERKDIEFHGVSSGKVFDQIYNYKLINS